ncbi:beta-hexosaminidase subunit beta-like isoform X2 [Crassostrea virginica]
MTIKYSVALSSTGAMRTDCGFICILCALEIVRTTRPAADYKSPHGKGAATQDWMEMSHEYVENPLILPEIPVGWDQKDFKLNFHGDPLKFKLRRAPIPTIGSPWPKPQKHVKDSKVLYRLRKDRLVIKRTEIECPTLQEGIERYKEQIFTCLNYSHDNNLRNIYDRDLRKTMISSKRLLGEIPLLTLLIVNITRCSFWPSLESNESYQLSSTADGIELLAEDVWGALRGLETLSQIIFCSQNTILIRKTKIEDFPRFRHRGIMVDTARHYIEKETLFQIMRGMEMNKFNVLHWHITDDQSFPYESRTFPELSKKGAFHPLLVYSQTDIKDILEFGRQRGIRVVPEIDTPAHVFSWSFGKPELLTQCYNSGEIVPALMGPLNPARNSTYSFLQDLYKEILSVFKDQLVHIGGDEVPFQCWYSNPEVVNFAKHLAKQFGSRTTDMKSVLKYFTKRFVDGILKEAASRENKVRLMVWEDSFSKDLFLPENTVVQLWYTGTQVIPDIVRRNLSVVFSSCWYVDLVEPGIKWHKFYNCDPEGPRSIPGVLGGEVCAWGEHITNKDILLRIWPISSAAAERLWSAKSVTNVEEAAPRLEEHRCRMLRRGVPVSSASGPGFCETQHASKPEQSQNRREININYAPQKQYICNKSLMEFTVMLFFCGILGFLYIVQRSKKRHYFKCFSR